jgi:hypothetical protein
MELFASAALLQDLGRVHDVLVVNLESVVKALHFKLVVQHEERQNVDKVIENVECI